MSLLLLWMVFLNTPAFLESVDDSAWQRSHPAVESKRWNQNSAACARWALVVLSHVLAGAQAVREWWSTDAGWRADPSLYWLFNLWVVFLCCVMATAAWVSWWLSWWFSLSNGRRKRNSQTWRVLVALQQHSQRQLEGKQSGEIEFWGIWVMGGKREMRMRL